MPSRYGYPINYAAIDVSSAGDNTLVAAVAGSQIIVVSLFLLANGTTSVTFQSSTTTALTGPITLVDQTGFVLPKNEFGWFATTAGELLNVNLSDAAQVSGSLGYFVS